MRKRNLVLLIVAALLVSACATIPRPGDILREISIAGSGNVVTREEAITGFDKVDVSHAFTVDISQGDTFRVVVRVDDNLVQYLEVVKVGSTLKVGLKPNLTVLVQRGTMEAEVTMPELAGLDMSGASSVTLSGFQSTKAFQAEVSGASSLQGDIGAGDSWFDVSGGSRATLSGSAQGVRIEVSGGSRIDLGDFSVVDADVNASGGSSATVNASGTLDADASGASQVYYLGSPTLGRVETSGASSVRAK